MKRSLSLLVVHWATFCSASFIFTIALITSVPFFTTPCRTSWAQCHIVPALTHLKVSGASWRDPHTYLSSLLIAIGLSMGLIGTVSNLYLNFLR